MKYSSDTNNGTGLKEEAGGQEWVLQPGRSSIHPVLLLGGKRNNTFY